MYAPRRKTVHWCVCSGLDASRPRPTLKAIEPYASATAGGAEDALAIVRVRRGCVCGARVGVVARGVSAACTCV